MRELNKDDFELAVPIINKFIEKDAIGAWINIEDSWFIKSWQKESCNKQKLLINHLTNDAWKSLKGRIRQARFRANKKQTNEERTTIAVTRENLQKLNGYLNKNNFSSLNETIEALMSNAAILTPENAKFVNAIRRRYHPDKKFSEYVNFLVEQKKHKAEKLGGFLNPKG